MLLLCSLLRAGQPGGPGACAIGLKGSMWVDFSAQKTPLSQIQCAHPVQATALWKAGSGSLAGRSSRGFSPPPPRGRLCSSRTLLAAVCSTGSPGTAALARQPWHAQSCPELSASASPTKRLPGELPASNRDRTTASLSGVSCKCCPTYFTSLPGQLGSGRKFDSSDLTIWLNNI